MSPLLQQLLQQIEDTYRQQLAEHPEVDPFLRAEALCHEHLYLAGPLLAQIIEQDPTLLGARAGGLIMDVSERDNPSVGVIISANLVDMLMERLLSIAVEQGVLPMDEEGAIYVNDAALNSDRHYPINVDYSRSENAQQHISRSGGLLNQIINRAETDYLARLADRAHDAYSLALQVATDHALFSPEHVAPLVAANPLMLGLRSDDMRDNEFFEGDPPAGVIIGAHLTEMLVDQLLQLALEQGALAMDGSGQLILPPNGQDTPVIH